ncbi:MAG: hypothetical protein PHQ27_05080, partial [Victivallales bacterium]|nr:hypothetical protein [Victivallales bacterium]
RELKQAIAVQDIDPDAAGRYAEKLIRELGETQTAEKEILRLELQVLIYRSEVEKLRGQIKKTLENRAAPLPQQQQQQQQ